MQHQKWSWERRQSQDSRPSAGIVEPDSEKLYNNAQLNQLSLVEATAKTIAAGGPNPGRTHKVNLFKKEILEANRSRGESQITATHGLGLESTADENDAK